MRSPRTSTAATTVLALLVSALLLAAPSSDAAGASGRVRGALYGADGTPAMLVRWFTRDWRDYLGTTRVRDGVYSLDLAPGTYRLQFVDLRPSYDLTKYAPADVLVTVRAGSTTTRSVHLHRGAAVYGVARIAGGPARHARVVAANSYRQSYSTETDERGRFAIGGLPTGRYSVFTYDRRREYVGRSTYLRTLRAGSTRRVDPDLRVRAGRLLVDLYAGSSSLSAKVNVTVTSLATGQWWSADTARGSVSFSGLYPGRYKIIVPDVGVWFGRSGTVTGGAVRSGRVAFGSFRLLARGGWLSGTAVDAGAPAYPIPGAQVQLYDADGSRIAETTTAANGAFTLSGRLATQAGLTVVVDPGPGSGGWVQTTSWCHFLSTDRAGLAVAAGEGTHLGAVAVRRDPDQTNPSCAS